MPERFYPIAKQCELCGEWFWTRRKKRRTCSDECRNILIRIHRWSQDMSGRVKIHKLVCPICSGIFEMTGAELNHSCRITCSDRCSDILRSRNATVRNAALSPETRALIGRKVASHPHTGHFETHACAKDWHLITPDGQAVDCVNLTLHIDNHPEIYAAETPDEKVRTYNGLSRLRPDRGDPRPRWFGWRWNDNYQAGLRVGAPPSTTIDIYGKEYRVTHQVETKHGWPIYYGIPSDSSGIRGPEIIITPKLRDHMIARSQVYFCGPWDLPISLLSASRIRRKLGINRKTGVRRTHEP
jgi:hypothetical protein